MADTELLPCAHCGCEPMLEEHPSHSHSVVLQALLPGLPDHPGSWTIECPTSGCVALIGGTCADVIAAWNRRAPVASRPTEVDDSLADAKRLDWLQSTNQTFCGNYSNTGFRAIGSSIWHGTLREAIDGAMIEAAPSHTTNKDGT